MKRYQGEGAQTLRPSLPWPLNIVRWRITFLGWQYGHFISCRSSGSQDFDFAPEFLESLRILALRNWQSFYDLPSLPLLLLLACCRFQLLGSVYCCDFTSDVAAEKSRRIQNTRGTIRINSKRATLCKRNEC